MLKETCGIPLMGRKQSRYEWKIVEFPQWEEKSIKETCGICLMGKKTIRKENRRIPPIERMEYMEGKSWNPLKGKSCKTCDRKIKGVC